MPVLIGFAFTRVALTKFGAATTKLSFTKFNAITGRDAINKKKEKKKNGSPARQPIGWLGFILLVYLRDKRKEKENRKGVSVFFLFGFDFLFGCLQSVVKTTRLRRGRIFTTKKNDGATWLAAVADQSRPSAGKSSHNVAAFAPREGPVKQEETQ